MPLEVYPSKRKTFTTFIQCSVFTGMSVVTVADKTFKVLIYVYCQAKIMPSQLSRAQQLYAEKIK